MAHKPLDDTFLERALPRRAKRKETLDALKADDGTAEPIADVVTAAPTEDPTAPAAPAAPEAPAAPAPAAPEVPAVAPETPPAAPKDEKPVVPLHLYTDTRSDLKRANQRIEELEKRIEEASKPKVEQPKAPEDPEPDERTHPVEHDQWKVREADRKIAKLEARLEEMHTGFTARTQEEENQRAAAQFRGTVEQLVERHRLGLVTDRVTGQAVPGIPDINERREFLRKLMKEENLDSGYDEATATALVDQHEFEYYVNCARRKVDPIAAIAKLAIRRGYQPTMVQAPAAPAKTATERIEDKARRQDAARSTSNMPGAPPARVEDDKMTAEQWRKLSPAQKNRYYKEHPEIKKGSGGMAALLLDDGIR